MNSPYVLPDSPTASGMKAGDIKKYHWQAYIKLIDIINKHLTEIYEVDTSLDNNIKLKSSIRYTSRKSLSYSLKYNSLKEYDVIIFGDVLKKDLSVIMVYSKNNLHLGIKLNESDINTFSNWKEGELYNYEDGKITFVYLGNTNASLKIDELQTILETLETAFETHSHQEIKDLADNARVAAVVAQNKADSAYNLASGKAKVHPVANVTDMYNLLQNNINEINEGDVFIIAEPLIPEFIVYLKDVDASEGDTTVSIDSMPEFAAGEKYYIADLRVSLLALESGIDTSKFATNEGLEEIEKVLTARVADIEQEFDNHKTECESKVNDKQDKLVKGQNLDFSPARGSDNPVTSGGVYEYISGIAEKKQDKLEFDDVPTGGSTNLVNSNGIFNAFCNFSNDYDAIIEGAKAECNQYTDNMLGNIDTALDSIIAIQNSLIGGEA